MEPKYGIHMTMEAPSEQNFLKEELSLLLGEVGRLQQIIAELLQKNQELRKALADSKV
jgi:hypothetical protein